MAQEPTLKDYAGRLPENTVFCLTWQNLDDLKLLRATNPLLRFLGSPEMKANWQALQEFEERRRRQQATAKAEKDTSATREEFELSELAPLLVNPGLFALVPNPTANDAAPGPPWVHLYLYDMTGMEETLASLEARSSVPGQVTKTYDFNGVTVEETLGPDGKPRDVRARAGHWLVGGGSRQAVEALIRAVQEPPQRALKDTTAYERAEPFRRPEAQVELFVNPQAASTLARRPPASAPPALGAPQLVGAVGLDDWELFFLTWSFEPERARYELTALHRPTAALPGLLGSTVSDFPSLGFAPPDTYSYSVAELDIAALWNYLNRLIEDQLPPAQSQAAAAFIGMAEEIFGVTLPDLAGAWGSEFTQFSFPGPDGEIHTVRAFALRQNQTVLSVLRNLVAAFGDKLELTELPPDPAQPDATYFRLLLPQGQQTQNDTGTTRERALFVAVTPAWLLVAGSRSEIQQALQRFAAGPSLRQSPVFLEARGRFPAALATFSFVDAQSWLASGSLAGFVRQIARAMADTHQPGERHDETAQSPAPDNPPPPPRVRSAQEPPELNRRPPPEPEPLEPPQFQVPQGYLKWLLSATTTDARGIYHTGYIE